MTRERALEILKTRRPTANPLRHLVDCLQNQTQSLIIQNSNKPKTSIEPTRKEQISQSFRELKKGSAEPCFELLDRLLKNIIDNSVDGDDNLKFRSVKKQNKKLGQFVTN